jgi:hypothetical protein
MRHALAALVVVFSSISPSLAEDAGTEADNGRFSFREVIDGVLRLDSRTGAVALCSKRAVGWACQAVPDDRAALESEMTRIENENALLRRELVARGIELPNGSKPPTGAPDSGAQAPSLPSDADLDRAMSFLQRAWRRLVEMVQQMQRELNKEAPLEGKGPGKGT